MVEQAGWLVPEHYGDVAAEVQAVREGMGVFDQCHYFRLRVGGSGANESLAALFGQTIALPGPDRQKTFAVNGGFCTIQRQNSQYLLIGPPELSTFLQQTLEKKVESNEISLKDETFSTAMVTLAGPNAIKLLKDKLPLDLSLFEPGDVVTQSIFFMKVAVACNDTAPPSATLILPAKMAKLAWDMLLKYGEKYGAKLAGTAAFSTVFNGFSVPDA